MTANEELKAKYQVYNGLHKGRQAFDLTKELEVTDDKRDYAYKAFESFAVASIYLESEAEKRLLS